LGTRCRRRGGTKVGKGEFREGTKERAFQGPATRNGNKLPQGALQKMRKEFIRNLKEAALESRRGCEERVLKKRKYKGGNSRGDARSRSTELPKEGRNDRAGDKPLPLRETGARPGERTINRDVRKEGRLRKVATRMKRGKEAGTQIHGEQQTRTPQLEDSNRGKSK